MDMWSKDWESHDNIKFHHKCRIIVFIDKKIWTTRMLAESAQHITLLLHNSAGEKCVISFIYAKNTQSERKELWDKLIEEAKKCSLPWCIIGDQNCVRLVKEKKEGNMLTWNNIQELNNFVNCAGLTEMNIVGSKFSWRSGPMKNISTRIDRVITNVEWLAVFSNSNASYMDITTSDHAPIQLNMSTISQIICARPFKFRNHWLKCKDYNELAKDFFKFPADKNTMYNIVQMQKYAIAELKE